MIPLSDDNPTLHPTYMTFAILAAIGATWLFVQGAGMNPATLAATVCNYGMVPGELTHLAPLGTGVPIGPNMACIVDNHAINTVPKETLVRITKAEDGGLGGKGVWKPATTGYGPSGASSQNQLYLTGALVRIEE